MKVSYFALLMTLYLLVRCSRSCGPGHLSFSEAKSVKSLFLNTVLKSQICTKSSLFCSTGILKNLKAPNRQLLSAKASLVTAAGASSEYMGQTHSTARESGENPQSGQSDSATEQGGFFSWLVCYFVRFCRAIGSPFCKLFGLFSFKKASPEQDPEAGRNLLDPEPDQSASQMKRSQEASGQEGDGPDPPKKISKEVIENNPDVFVIQHLTKCLSLSKPNDIRLEEFIKNSEQFSRKIDFPIDSIRCEVLRNEGDITTEVLENNINSAYPVLHETAVELFINFLEYKKKNGSEIEKSVYLDLDLTGLVQRLLEKRAVVFYTGADYYYLMDGSKGTGGWENVGKSNEKSPLKLTSCLSYDEIKLSALLSVSSHSIFINDGNRNNRGVPSSVKLIVRNGVVIGLIGARFEREELMDWQEILITEHQNTPENGYGPVATTDPNTEKLYYWRKIWSSFYDLKPNLPSYEEAKQGSPDRFSKLDRGIFDNYVYKKRLQVSLETLLLEADSRAKAANTQAYVHVVGIGLGVWMISGHQQKLFMDAFADSLRNLLPKLEHVSDINFSWFRENSCGGVENGKYFTAEGTQNKIRILFSKRNPHEQLPEKDSEKLLIVSYAWDGNSLPGNEFWLGQLSASGDPAQAASSQIAELHNAHINTGKVSGKNLHIATSEWGVIHISEYAKRKLQLTSHH